MARSVAKSGSRETHNWLDPFDSLHEEMDRVFGDYFKRLPMPHLGFRSDGAGRLFANLDVSESDNHVTVVVDVPGVKRDDIDITLTDSTLQIKGKRESRKEEKSESIHRVERDYGSFERRISLPCEVDADRVEAGLKEGVLTIQLPKSAKAKEQARRIEIHE